MTRCNERWTMTRCNERQRLAPARARHATDRCGPQLAILARTDKDRFGLSAILPPNHNIRPSPNRQTVAGVIQNRLASLSLRPKIP
jgi:hypothetical protein